MTVSKIQTPVLAEVLKGKIVVCDTSSLLVAGTYLLDQLEDTRVIVPAVVVRELEHKRSHATLGFIAREWLRLIEGHRVANGGNLRTGVTVAGSNGVELRVEPNHSNQKSLPTQLQDGSHDSTVLAVAVNFKAEGHEVVLLSNDMPMRLHATLELELEAIEYVATVADDQPFLGRFKLDLKASEVDSYSIYGEGLDGRLARRVLADLPEGAASTSFTEVFLAGESSKTAVLVTNGKPSLVTPKNKVLGVTGKTVEQNVLIELLQKPAEELPVVSVGGGAGTGKTLLTIATALQELKSGHYERIMVFRSLHEMGQGQEMGFLPGDVDDKMGPWAGAIFDAIDTLARIAKPLKKNATMHDIEKQKEESKKLREMVEIAPITYLRGRSLDKTFMVLEEAQNFSRSEILNILSRTGSGTKVVLTWDAAQVDSRFLKSGKDADVWSVVSSLQDRDIFGHITLTKTERSRVAEIASEILEHG